MKKVIKLNVYSSTTKESHTILIGLDSIIEVKPFTYKDGTIGSKILSRGAMVETNWVKETVDEIYNLINS